MYRKVSLLEEWTGHNSIQCETKKFCVDRFVLLVSNLIKATGVSYEPRNEKTGFSHMRKQSR